MKLYSITFMFSIKKFCLEKSFTIHTKSNAKFGRRNTLPILVSRSYGLFFFLGVPKDHGAVFQENAKRAAILRMVGRPAHQRRNFFT